MSRSRTPGCCVGVSIDGKTVFRYSCGYSDLDNGVLMTGEEYFNIYSCSKITTSVAGMQLLESGKIKLEDDLYNYIPEFSEMCIKNGNGDVVKAKNKIKVSDLFCMSAGFDYNFANDSVKKLSEKTKNRYTTAQFARVMAKEPLSFEPGTHWQYSLCHDILAGLISIVSGQDFGKYVFENIFEPLGMQKSVYHHTEEIERKMATQYKFVTDDQNEKKLRPCHIANKSFVKHGIF